MGKSSFLEAVQAGSPAKNNDLAEAPRLPFGRTAGRIDGPADMERPERMGRKRATYLSGGIEAVFSGQKGKRFTRFLLLWVVLMAPVPLIAA